MDIYVNDNPIRLRLNLGDNYDVGSDPVAIRYTKPDGTTGTWTATKQSANVVYYDTADGDLDQAGKWMLQGVHDPSGDPVHHGRSARLVVKAWGT